MATFDTAGKSAKDISLYIVRCEYSIECMEERKAKHMRNILDLQNDIALKRCELAKATAAYVRNKFDDTVNITGNRADFMIMANIILDMPRNDPKEIEWRMLLDNEKHMLDDADKMQEQIDFKYRIVHDLKQLLVERGELYENEEGYDSGSENDAVYNGYKFDISTPSPPIRMNFKSGQ
jgi:hypothetical protein